MDGWGDGRMVAIFESYFGISGAGWMDDVCLGGVAFASSCLRGLTGNNVRWGWGGVLFVP